jgi:hypothetical protein
MGASAAIAACSGDNPIDATSLDSTALVGAHYIQARIDSVVATGQDDAAASLAAVNEQCGRPSEQGYVAIQRHTFCRYRGDGARDPGYRSLQIIFVRNFAAQPAGRELDALLSLGRISFGSEGSSTNGVELRWIDASGAEWSTAYGSADQSASTFVVREHTEQPYSQGSRKGGRYLTRGVFAATLYDASGRSLRVRDGHFAIETVWGW